jgi:hypothetical protein
LRKLHVRLLVDVKNFEQCFDGLRVGCARHSGGKQGEKGVLKVLNGHE